MPIKSRLVYVFLTMAIFPMLFAGFLIFNSTKKALRRMVFSKVNQTLTKRANTLESRLRQLVVQVELASKYPPIQGIIRSGSSGIDPFDQALHPWKQRV